MRKQKLYLACPYEEKDDAKELGAWWDPDAKKWYVPDGIDRNLFKRWWITDVVEAVEEVASDIPF